MTMKLRITLFSLFCFCVTIALRAERVDMIKAGAATDGKSLNTRLINSTIDRLNANGGGTLYFPAGTYLTGSIRMKSNITLELEAGATLLFSDNFCGDALRRGDDEELPAFDLCRRCGEHHHQGRRNSGWAGKEVVDGVLSRHD